MSSEPLTQKNLYSHYSIFDKLVKLYTKDKLPNKILFSGDHIADQIVDYRQVKKFSIEPMIDCELGIDGEILGNTPINAEVLSSAIQVLV